MPSSKQTKTNKSVENRPWFKYLKQYAAYEENENGTTTLVKGKTLADQALDDMSAQQEQLISELREAVENIDLWAKWSKPNGDLLLGEDVMRAQVLKLLK